jgi:hypothetical protein
MTTIERDALILGAAAVGVYLLMKNAGKLAGAVVGAAADAGAGAAIAVGDVLGVPHTNMTECEKAIAEGRTWDSSFVCPAGTFLRGVFD